MFEEFLSEVKEAEKIKKSDASCKVILLFDKLLTEGKFDEMNILYDSVNVKDFCDRVLFAFWIIPEIPSSESKKKFIIRARDEMIERAGDNVGDIELIKTACWIDEIQN